MTRLKLTETTRDYPSATRRYILSAWGILLMYEQCDDKMAAQIPLTACTSFCFLTSTSTLHYGNQVPTTEGARRHCLLVERGNRRHQSREGGLEHNASKGHFWDRQCPPRNDQGTFLPLPP